MLDITKTCSKLSEAAVEAGELSRGHADASQEFTMTYTESMRVTPEAGLGTPLVCVDPCLSAVKSNGYG
jgi:hypothetical protein